MSEHQSSEFGTAISGLIGIVILVALVYTLTAAQLSGSGDTGTPEQIAARIAPVGSVTLAGSEAAAAAAAPATASAPADEGPGAAIFNKACTACHATGVAGAPKMGDKAAWQPRIARGLDLLLQTVINGKGAMPPRGTCMDCSDDDLKVAIEYMLVQVGYEPAPAADAAAAEDAGNAEGADGTSGMGGMPGMGGMGGMPGMSGMSGMGAMSKEGPDRSAVDLPSAQGGSSPEGMSGMQGEQTREYRPEMQ